MKRIYSYIGSLLMLLLVFSSCTDEFNNPSEEQQPLAADIDAEILVNQETNEVTFRLNNPESYPVWIFEEPSKTTYSSVNGLTKVYTLAGTYSVEIKIGNSNGLSDGSITRTFEIENSLLDPNPGGYDSENDCNFWKDVIFTNEFYYAPGWSQIDNPGFEADGNLYKITLPSATTDQWQAQVKFLTNLTTSTEHNYDFSAVFFSNKAHGNVTVKLVKTGDDATFYFTETISLEANEDYVLIMTDMPGLDMENVSLVLDFGGNAEGTEVLVRRIVLKEHSCDDGTVIEEPEEPGEDPVNWLPDSECNLWKDVEFADHVFYAPGWSPELHNGPDYAGLELGDNNYTVAWPTATSAQWQAQLHLRTTNVATTADKTYDFRVILNSTKNITGITIKLTKVGDDAAAFFTEQVNLTANQDYTFKMSAIQAKKGVDFVDIDNISLVFDFGGNPADTEVTIRSVILKESTCNN